MSSFIEAQLGLRWDTSVFLMHWPARPALASVYEVFLSAGNVHWGQLRRCAATARLPDLDEQTFSAPFGSSGMVESRKCAVA